MEDDESISVRICTDLVSLRSSEAFPLQLLLSKQAGEWVCVRAFCQQIGVHTDGLPTELFAAWLPDPMALDGYAVIMFYDDASKWSMAAHYNRGRLMGEAPPNQSLKPVVVASPPTSCSVTQQAAAAAKVLGRNRHSASAQVMTRWQVAVVVPIAKRPPCG